MLQLVATPSSNTFSAFPPELLWVFGGILAILCAATVTGRLMLARSALTPATSRSHPTIPPSPHAGQRFAANWIARVHAWWWMVSVLAAVLLTIHLTDSLWPLVTFFALLSLLSLREYFATAQLTRQHHSWLLLSFYVLLPMQYALWIYDHSVAALLLTPLYGVAALYALTRSSNAAQRRSLRDVASGVIVCIYGLSFPMALAIANGQGTGIRATLQLVFLLVISQASDVFQFVAGKLWGKRKIAERLSPHKTVEGLLGGLVGATLLGATLWWLTPYSPIGAAFLGLGVAILGFLGGLYLSAKKRSRGIKDWGTIIPGHGGILDRLDSLWLSAPLMLLAMKW